jgi:hypothetical protein
MEGKMKNEECRMKKGGTPDSSGSAWLAEASAD